MTPDTPTTASRAASPSTAPPTTRRALPAGLQLMDAPPYPVAGTPTPSPAWSACWQQLADLTQLAAQDHAQGQTKYWSLLTQTVAATTGSHLCVLYVGAQERVSELDGLVAGAAGAAGVTSAAPPSTTSPSAPTTSAKDSPAAPSAPPTQTWRISSHWPAAPTVTADKLPPLLLSVPQPVLQQALEQGVGFGLASSGRWQVGVVSLPAAALPKASGQGQASASTPPMMLVIHLSAQPAQSGPHAAPQAGGQPASPLPEASIRAMLGTLRGLPLLLQAHRQTQAAEHDYQRLAITLELLGRVAEAPDFQTACLALADDLASQFDAHTVSLSWQAREGLRLRAISHAEALERRSEHTALLEEAQQEAISQASELVWPPASVDTPQILRAHHAYAQLQQPGYLASVPLWGATAASAPGGRSEHPVGPRGSHDDPAHGGAVTPPGLGAITLERQHRAFTTTELWALRLIADLVTPTLALLEQRHQPLAKRLWRESLRSVPKALKPQTLSGKRLAVGLSAAALLAMLLPVPYTVDAGAVVKADTMALVGAPFDGYIEASPITLGSEVRAGDLLVTLATRELKLERANLLADLAQHQREAEKRRNANQLPEMQIAEAQAAQTLAKLQQTDYRLSQAEIRAPIAGIVVEGEPAKNLGGAVRRGETVVKVAALQPLHIEASVPERDLNLISVGASARIKLLAMPDDTRTLQVQRVIPAAAVKDGHNSFPVRLDVGSGVTQPVAAPQGASSSALPAEVASPSAPSPSAPSPSTAPSADGLDQAIPATWRPGMSGVAKIDTGWQALGWVLSRRAVDAVRLWVWW